MDLNNKEEWVEYLRDHAAYNENQWRIAALTHDTFSAATHVTWSSNEKELRNFYSLNYLIRYLARLGLRFDGKVLFQKGDPTKNGLMAFTKV